MKINDGGILIISLDGRKSYVYELSDEEISDEIKRSGSIINSCPCLRVKDTCSFH